MHPSDLPAVVRRAAHPFLLAAALLVLLPVPPAYSQEIRDREKVDFDRPEAWAMAWFAAVTYPSVLAPPAALEPGEVELAFEGGWVPSLSEEQRTVGFAGDKPEDLNRTTVLGRPRLTVGLPGQLAATVGWVPPVELGGIEPSLLFLSLARPIWQGESTVLAARLLAERGSMRGDLTCPSDVAADRKPNPYGCELPSRDELSVRVFGLEVQAGTTFARWPRLSPYVALARSRVHAEFQVDNRRNGLHDLSLKETDGNVWSGTLGLALDAGSRTRLAGELFYTPLDVVGRAGKGKQSDGLLNARVLLGYRLR